MDLCSGMALCLSTLEGRVPCWLLSVVWLTGSSFGFACSFTELGRLRVLLCVLLSTDFAYIRGCYFRRYADVFGVIVGKLRYADMLRMGSCADLL